MTTVVLVCFTFYSSSTFLALKKTHIVRKKNDVFIFVQLKLEILRILSMFYI